MEKTNLTWRAGLDLGLPQEIPKRAAARLKERYPGSQEELEQASLELARLSVCRLLKHFHGRVHTAIKYAKTHGHYPMCEIGDEPKRWKQIALQLEHDLASPPAERDQRASELHVIILDEINKTGWLP
jgi:hypothetical protein